MALTKEQRQEAAAKARAAKAEKQAEKEGSISVTFEARADTSQPSVQDQPKAGFAEATGIEPTSYVYVGKLSEVLVVIDGRNYEFRAHQPVYLSHAEPALDASADFERA